jgi:hypothetical protein
MQTLSAAWNSVALRLRGYLALLLGSVLLFGLRTRRSASQQYKAYCWGWWNRIHGRGCGMILTHKCRTQLEEDL